MNTLLFLFGLFILPNVSFTLWGVSRGIKEALGIKQKYVLPVIILFIFVLSFFLNNRNKINLLNTWTGQMGFVYIYVYLPVLWLIQNGQNKVKEINMKRWILFLILSVFLIGCAKTKIVDDIDLVQVAAYDTEAEGKLKGTFAISAYKGGGKVKQKSIQHQARLVEKFLQEHPKNLLDL